MKKNITILIMMILLITVLCAKHLSAQTFWAENGKTNQRKYFNVNQQISYKLNTSTNFHKGRIISFTDTTFTVQIKGDKLVTLGFRKLSAIKIPRSGGRRAGGLLVVALGTVSLIAAISAGSSHSTPPSNSNGGMSFGGFSSNLNNGLYKEVSATGIAVALLTLPIGIALLNGKTINLKKDWTLKTK